MFRLISWLLIVASIITVSCRYEFDLDDLFDNEDEYNYPIDCSMDACGEVAPPLLFDVYGNRLGCCKASNMNSESIIRNSDRRVGVLIIEKSEIPRIPENLLTNYRPTSLRIINCGLMMLKINDFTDSSQLKQLNLTLNKIENLEPNVFIYAPYIELIDLSNNRINEVSEYAFENVPKLRILILTKNFIKSINFKSNLINLEIFMIGNNLLTQLNENLFRKSTNLKELCINDNNLNISKLNVGKELEVFDMSNNPTSINLIAKIFKIKNTTATILNINKTAVNIDASNNRINSIVIDPDNNLLELNLSQNNYTTIQNLTILKSIQKLDLSFNQIQDFTLTSFANMTELRELNLENSGLKVIDYGIFSQQKDLNWLDISYNNLREINFNMLTTQIEYLYIEGNGLTNIDMADIHITLPNLLVLGLSNNNFSCEKLVEIRKQLTASSIRMYVDETLMVKFSKNVNGIGCINQNSTEKMEFQLNKLLPIHRDGSVHNSLIETIEGKIKEIEKNILQHNDSLTENAINSRDDVLSMKQDLMNIRNDIDLKVIDAKSDILMSVASLFNISNNGSVASVDLKSTIEEVNKINLERFQSLSSQLKLVKDKLQDLVESVANLKSPENFNQKNVLPLKRNSDVINDDSNSIAKGSSGDLISLKNMMTFIIVAIILIIFGFASTVFYKRHSRRRRYTSTNTVNTNIEQSLV